MERKSYLVFTLNGARYGVQTSSVQEIFFLPVLTSIDEAPLDIVGVINLRGEILPVMDLNLRFGHRAREYKITDSIIVLEWQELKMGLIVNQVHEVQEIGEEAISTQVSYGRQMTANSHHFVIGVAKNLSDLIMLLDPEQLIKYSESRDTQIQNGIAPHTEDRRIDATALESDETEPGHFYLHATPEEKAIFKERAENLMRPTEGQDFTGLMPLAVVGLNGEYFGVDLNVVREFTDIDEITPIPCSPPHIIGNMNLRGEILTLVDIRRALNIPMNQIGDVAKAMVVHLDDLVAGVTIEEVCDVMYLHPSQLTSVPAAVHSANDEYLRGTAPYRNKMMSLLDLPKILTQGDLEVNEEP